MTILKHKGGTNDKCCADCVKHKQIVTIALNDARDTLHNLRCFAIDQADLAETYNLKEKRESTDEEVIRNAIGMLIAEAEHDYKQVTAELESARRGEKCVANLLGCQIKGDHDHDY